ncbi:MAG: AbrB/MazE/SpoVT family DNA-binding domain-containing protein [Clostridia bacterium]|nr:AbrB/MazE/SpoVT family DNA-binding domain-containing protein [Clostridia bacterium]
MQVNFFDNAKVMAKGQVTIPKDIRTLLGVSEGDRVSFVVENGVVKIVNAAVFAMQMLQKQMQAEENLSENEVMELVKDVRREVSSDESID